MKYKIERNTVQETLILPLYSRKLCSELYPNLYRDETAVRLIDKIDYDFSVAEKNSRSLMQRFGALEVAMRQRDLAWEVRDYLKTHPCAAVVNLGCGLDNTGRACDNGRCKIYNLDFPDVIALRQQLLPAGEREQNIPCDLKDPAWFDKIDASGGAVFFASGVFYYFLTQQVRELVQGMADAFPGGVLVFDADFEGEKYRRTCLRFFKLMCVTSLGKLCASDHAMNAIDEMSALNRDLRKFFDEHGAAYPVWQELEAEAGRYLQ